MIKVSILGAGGRMGGAVIRALASHDRLRLHGALVRKGSDQLGTDAGTNAGLDPAGVRMDDDLARVIAGADVVIDFTLPEATVVNAGACEAADCALVIGSTGHSDEQKAWLHAHAWKVPVVLAPNMSVGVNVLYQLASIAARALPDFDAEICEVHHQNKQDAPSGTALRLGEAVADARAQSFEQVARYGRGPADGRRLRGEIGISVLRAGDVVGEHTLLLAGAGERLELRHLAQDRGSFASGALKAAAWVREEPPGLYDMGDVLGFSDGGQ